MIIFMKITFFLLISTNSSFTLYAAPTGARIWRKVPLLLPTSTIPKLVWPLKFCECKNKSKEISRVNERNTNLSLNHDTETAPNQFVNIRVVHPTLWENNLENALEPINIRGAKNRTGTHGHNHSKVKVSINLNRDININNSVRRSSAPNKSNSSVENKSNVTFRAKESKFTTLQEFYTSSLEEFDRRFYNTTFNTLTALQEATRPENGISFVHSGLLLWLTLIGLSTEVDKEARNEIDKNLQLNASDVEREQIITDFITSLPTWTVDMKFHWGSRLVMRKGMQLSERFRREAATRLRLQIDYFERSESPGDMADMLNKMVEIDSGGKIRNTFEAEDLNDVEALLVTTLYLRARWRTAPTLLNGTHAFNSSDLEHQAVRMIRINDVVKYARLDELNAEAIEIFYFNPDLSFLILLPNENSLRHLAHKMSETKLETITDKMRSVRVATILPLYTLRMTLLLPNKLRAMGISRFMSTDNTTEIDSIHITHAVQRLMFWAEAGRYAFKDDGRWCTVALVLSSKLGIEWDEKPEREVLIDRPYIFYVRWKNMTIMNGNFVL